MAENLSERILELLGPGQALDDDEIAARLKVVRQQANQTRRLLADRGVLTREPGWRGKLVNRATGLTPPAASVPAPTPTAAELVSEDEVKEAVRAHLEARGYEVTVAWGRAHGIDLEATGPEVVSPSTRRATCLRSSSRRTTSSGRWVNSCGGCRIRARPTAWPSPTFESSGLSWDASRPRPGRGYVSASTSWPGRPPA